MEILKSQPSCLSPGWPMNLSVSVLQEKHRLLCEAHLCTLAQQKNPLPNKGGEGRKGDESGGKGGGGEGKEEEGTKASHSGLCLFPQISPFQDLPFFSCTQISALFGNSFILFSLILKSCSSTPVIISTPASRAQKCPHSPGSFPVWAGAWEPANTFCSRRINNP